MNKKPKCKASREDGQRCAAFAAKGSEFCFWHNPANRKAVAEAGRTGGSRGKLATLPAENPDLPCATPQQALEAVQTLLNAVAKGGIDPRVANAAGTLLNTWRALYELARAEAAAQQDAGTEHGADFGDWSSVANWLRSLAQQTGLGDVLQLAAHLEATAPADRQRA